MNYNRYPLPNTRNEGEQRAGYSDDDTLLEPGQVTAPNTVAEGFGGSIPPHEQARIYRLNKEKGPGLSSRIVLGLAGAATTLAAIGGVWAAVLVSKAKNEAPEPNDRPSTSAPAVPGETLAPTDESSINTYPFKINGETYKGVDALEEAFAIKVDENAEFPDGEQIVREGVDRLNLWLNYGTTNPEESKAAEGKISQDHERVGIGAVIQDIANPAMARAFTTESSSMGTSVDGFVNTIDTLHLQNTAYGYQTMKAGDVVGYESKFTITGPINVHVAINEGISATVPVTWADNGDQNTMGKLRTEDSDGWDGVTEPVMRQDNLLHISFEQAEGANGQRYWKISSANLG